MISERFQEVSRNIKAACERTLREPGDVLLLVATKRHSVEEIKELALAGATCVGENHVQELLEKYAELPQLRWHFIGHLQTNKVKYICDKVVMIHSVDSIRVAREIDKRMKPLGRAMDVLIEVNIGGEASKSGIKPSELRSLVIEILENTSLVRIRGIMVIPPRADSEDKARGYFREARALLRDMKTWQLGTQCFAPGLLSMGMSSDYEIAVEEGSNIVRVGSYIMGERNN